MCNWTMLLPFTWSSVPQSFSLYASDQHKEIYGQLYMFDSSEATEKRLSNNQTCLQHVCGDLTTVIPRKGKVELSSPPPQGFILRFLLTLPPSGCRF
ncbi:hypothetical protein AVEN_258576-1 [Araneus ventricosus]|uniref:Uncharacterized protein n=1 Tax=Araneus ventricosus TaxID=182803 RepID=A0A4Y2RLN5_ARAVE|nr:hypothetical protein AVEN_258576-1 [Araneus ventricosus]